jgi:hypothetical protein
MPKIILKVFPLGLFILSMSAQAQYSKEFLANCCVKLAQTVTTLGSSQNNSICIDKLHLASKQINTAARLILEEDTESARQNISEAIHSLRYAELSNCQQYIQISHSKLEARKLRELL